MIKRILITAYLFTMVVPLLSQAVPDSVYLFRFKPGNDVFYVPYCDNDANLDNLLSMLSANMEQLKKGERYISVSSYGASSGGGFSSFEISRLRSLRVKSELVIRGKIKESMFVTDQPNALPYNADIMDVVVVTFPANVEKVARIVGPEAAERVKAYNIKISGYTENERVIAETVAKSEQEESVSTEAERKAAEQVSLEQEETERCLADEQNEREPVEAEKQMPVQEEEKMSVQVEPAVRNVDFASYGFALRANLLRWATLTPDLGVEWRVNRNLSVLVDATYTVWTWNSYDRRYALWEVTPEVRYYLGNSKRYYLGAMYKVGSFDYKLSAIGKQGDLMGGGFTGGYRMYLNKSFFMDFSIGLGYIHADFEKYVAINGVRVSRGYGKCDWWGPVHAGVTLVWTLF